MKHLTLHILPDHLAVCRLPADAPIPERPPSAAFWAVTYTGEELSVVLPQEAASPRWRVEPGWRCLKVLGPLDFGLTGVLAAIAVPLAEAGVPIFALSTYDTDYVLVKGEDLDRAKEALRACGHVVEPSSGLARPGS